jgi:hydrogenase nickel incorporation protein HypA/HybF
MHELSIAMSVVELVLGEVSVAETDLVTEVEIEVGAFSGVDSEALEFALSLAVKDTILAQTFFRIMLMEGEGYCKTCKKKFMMPEIFTRCPDCNGHTDLIISGDQLRVASLTIN